MMAKRRKLADLFGGKISEERAFKLIPALFVAALCLSLMLGAGIRSCAAAVIGG